MSQPRWKFLMIHPETGKEHILIGGEWRAELSLEAFGDMILAAQECPVEVGGKHKVVIDRKRKVFYTPQIWIPSQVCSRGHFELTGEAEFAAMTEAEKGGLNWDEFRLGHWHSHGNGYAVLSGVDLRSTEEHMEFFHKDWAHAEFPWRDHEVQIEFVVNRQGNISARFSAAVPVVCSFFLPVGLVDGVSQEHVAEYFDANRQRIHDLVFEKVKVAIGREGDGTEMTLSEFTKHYQKWR